MIKKIDKKAVRVRKHHRVRKSLSGTPERPRLCVFRSSKHIYSQIIDDVNAKTLVSASTVDPELRKELTTCGNREAAKKVGELVAKRAVAQGIEEVVFDRGGYLYHGRVASLADGAREGGLKF